MLDPSPGQFFNHFPYYLLDFHQAQQSRISLEDTISAIHNWSERKNKLFKNEYIQIAYDHLDTFYGKSKLSAGNSSSALPEYSEP